MFQIEMTKRWRRKRSRIWGLITAKKYVNWFLGRVPRARRPGNQTRQSRRGASVNMKNAEPLGAPQNNKIFAKAWSYEAWRWMNKRTMEDNCSNTFIEALQTLWRDLHCLQEKSVPCYPKEFTISADASQHQAPTPLMFFLQRVSPGCANILELAQHFRPYCL